MKAVGIKVLKAKLSEYVRLVKSGETILVTERDEVVAELCPSRRQALPPETMEEALKLLAAKGEATLSSAKISEWGGFSTKLKGLGISSQKLLDALREDRF